MFAPEIRIHDAYLAYRNVVLFNHLNLTLKAGKLTCLLGPSGVGKTSLLRIIAGLMMDGEEESFQAKVTCDDQVLLTTQITYLAQTDLLLPWFNALDNALLGPRLRGTMTEESKNKAKELFAQTGLLGAEGKYPHQLSGGMRQRVALVRTLIENKPIMLMDEPFSSLDAITRFQLQTLAAHFLKNRTVLLVTHDPLEALRLADEIYILANQPALLTQVARLHSPSPRDVGSTEVLQHQAALFQALAHAQEANHCM